MAKVLIIDDDGDIRSLLKHALESEGYEVYVAHDGAEGQRMQQRCRADVIVTDIFMPNIEGIETIRSLKHDYPGIRIVAMSGGGKFKGQGHLFTAKELGAVTILRKPFEMSALLDAVSDALKS